MHNHSFKEVAVVETLSEYTRELEFPETEIRHSELIKKHRKQRQSKFRMQRDRSCSVRSSSRLSLLSHCDATQLNLEPI